MELQLNKVATALNLNAGKLMVAYTTTVNGSGEIFAANVHDVQELSKQGEPLGNLYLMVSGKTKSIGRPGGHFKRVPGLFVAQ